MYLIQSIRDENINSIQQREALFVQYIFDSDTKTKQKESNKQV